MAYDHLNRSDRRAMAKFAKEEAAKRPVRLTEIPRETWPAYPNPDRAPTKVWQSRKYIVQLFDEKPFLNVDTRRMTVCRVTLGDDGHWDAGLSWDELQDVKNEIGFGDWYGLEIYPRDQDVVNVANMRHVWLMAVPLELGWFTARR
jgi:hypothetical protein